MTRTSRPWTAADLPSQEGRTVVVTGANSGLGAVTARELARAGARVIVACRDTAKGRSVAADFGGDVRELDLADLDSVRAFAGTVDGPVDVLVNNAGVMATPHRRTRQGFELQLGTNHLGHFALTGLLLDRLLAAPKPRVTTVSSLMHAYGRVDLADLQWERRRYNRWLAYAQSKLANLLFSHELQRRSGGSLLATAAHPGYAATGLQSHTESIQDAFMKYANAVVAQSAEGGALPTLYAATMPVPGGAFVGPDGLRQLRGFPRLVGCSRAARDQDVASRLWESSEELTGVRYDFGG